MSGEWLFYCEKDVRYNAEVAQKFDARVFLNKTTELVCKYVMDEKTRVKHERRLAIEKQEKQVTMLGSQNEEYKKKIDKFKSESWCSTVCACLLVVISVTQVLALFMALK